MTRDLMYQDEIRGIVRDAYAAIPSGAGATVAERLYSAEVLQQMPAEAIEWALGVGDPVGGAGLSAGEAVLDLGCGGGIDAIFAARAVGAAGHVVGVDLLEEMCERARAAAARAGVAGWTEFRPGAIEDIPLPDESIDVVVSNGVLNLSARKSRALAEIFRVLRPGGRISITDLVVDDELPPEVLTSEAAWAG